MTSTLHTKYRPSKWSEIVGHKLVIPSIQATVASGSSHAFILSGSSGVGKTTIARIIASEVGCRKGNLLEVDAATTSGVDTMREITESLNFAALGQSSVKVVIVDEAHALSKAAWQSLLKSVEEPPPHVFWIFCTTEPSKIPDTIQTRCAKYDLKPVGTDDIYGLLAVVAEEEKLQTPDDIIFHVAERSQGSPRRALSYLAQCSHCRSLKDASQLLETVVESDDIINLCRSLIKGLDWKKAVKLVQPLREQNAESVRITICAYLTSVALNTESDDSAGKILEILDCFVSPYPTSSGVAPLLMSMAKVVFPQ